MTFILISTWTFLGGKILLTIFVLSIEYALGVGTQKFQCRHKSHLLCPWASQPDTQSMISYCKALERQTRFHRGKTTRALAGNKVFSSHRHSIDLNSLKGKTEHVMLLMGISSQLAANI